MSQSFELDPNSRERSFPARGQKLNPSKRMKILFEGHLPQEYSRPNLPNELAQKRNWTIRALYFQFLATFTGFCLFLLRRVYYSHYHLIDWHSRGCI